MCYISHITGSHPFSWGHSCLSCWTFQYLPFLLRPLRAPPSKWSVIVICPTKGKAHVIQTMWLILNYLTVRHLLFSCTSPMMTTTFIRDPAAACGFPLFQTHIRNIKRCTALAEPSSRQTDIITQHNGYDQLIPSHTQLWQVPSQLVPQ